MNGWVVFGALLGAAAVTGVGIWVEVRQMQAPEFTRQAQARAETAASMALSSTYGLTPQRMQQFSQIAQRFRT